MKFLIFQLLIFLLILSSISCKTSQTVNYKYDEHNEIKSKVIDGVTVYYYEAPFYNEQNIERDTIRNKNEIEFGGNGRRIVKRNWRALFENGDQYSLAATIAIKICVNRESEVLYAEILPDETTTADSRRFKQALLAAKGYRVEEDQNAASEECDKLVFNLDVSAKRKK